MSDADTPPPKKEIIVTCAIQQGSVERVAKRLREAGFDVREVLEFTGSIVGGWNKPLKKLREIPEVVAVEESGTKYPQ